MSEQLFGLADLPALPKVAAATPQEKDRIVGASRAHLMAWEDVVVGDDNVRDAAKTDIAGLAKSIRLVGLMQPIAVEPFDGKWLVAAGHRRYLALAALGWGAGDRLPVHRLAASTGADRPVRMLAENGQRVDLSPIEEAQAIDRLKRWHRWTQAAIAKHMGVSSTTVGARLLLLQLPPDLQAAVVAGSLPVDLGARIGRMVRDGASEDDMARLSVPGLTSVMVDAVEYRRKVRAACERLSARLESRGLKVLASPPAGFVRGEWLGQDEGEVMGVIGVGDRVLVEAGSYGSAAAFAIVERPQQQSGRSDDEGGLEDHAEDLAVRGRHQRRMGWLSIRPPVPTVVLHRTMLTILVEDDPEGVGAALGKRPVTGADGTVDVAATVGQWLPATVPADVLQSWLVRALVSYAEADDHEGGRRERWRPLIELGMPAFGRWPK